MTHLQLLGFAFVVTAQAILAWFLMRVMNRISERTFKYLFAAMTAGIAIGANALLLLMLL
jgi:hypothetical protein